MPNNKTKEPKSPVPETYDQVLARRVQPEFENYIRPWSVLPYFYKYDETVLTRRDEQNVKAAADQRGDIEGALTLLERLCAYPGWFECVLNVLRDREVKLPHVAEMMKEKKAKLDKEWRDDASHSKQSSRGSESEFHLSRTTPPGSRDGTAGPDDGYIEPTNVYSNDQDSGAIGLEDDNDDSIEDDYEIINETDGLDETTVNSLTSPQTDTRIPQDVNSTESADGTSSGPVYHDAVSSEGATETPQAAHQSKAQEVLPKKKRTKAKQHGAEYDFSQEDTATELSQCQGWHSVMTEKSIWQTLAPLLEEDGHYILWYWEQKKRPTLCVTDKKALKTFLVHKRPDSTDRNKTSFYFIDKKQRRSDSLRELLEYHIEHGVKDLTKGNVGQPVSFLHPVGTGVSGP